MMKVNEKFSRGLAEYLHDKKGWTPQDLKGLMGTLGWDKSRHDYFEIRSDLSESVKKVDESWFRESGLKNRFLKLLWDSLDQTQKKEILKFSGQAQDQLGEVQDTLANLDKFISGIKLKRK